MNLLWLKYVSYVFSAGAALLYLTLRTRSARLSRGRGIALYLGCLALGCTLYNVGRLDVYRNSPRQLVMGKVVSVHASTSGRSHRITDDFRLQVGVGKQSPTFSTGIVADDISRQPIHQGDVLGVLYRTWDDEPLTIDEIDGQQPGWHYRDSDSGSLSLAGFVFIGLLGLASILTTKDGSDDPKSMPDDSVSLHLNDT